MTTPAKDNKDIIPPENKELKEWMEKVIEKNEYYDIIDTFDFENISDIIKKE